MAGASWRRRRALRKVKDGDGSRLKTYRPWHGIWRSLFGIELPLDAADRASVHHYQVDVDFFDWSSKAVLYRNGVQHAVATMPALFPVPGGVIDVRSSMAGMKRVHYVPDEGDEQVLTPHRGTAEAWRARLDRRFPRVSRVIAVTAVVILLVGLAIAIPAGIEQVTNIPWVAENIGSFTSPLTVPAEAAIPLLVAGILAATERALSLRNHWLIDADTWFLGD